MIILAGAIILSLNNTGIINQANKAVKDTDEATVKTLAELAWAEAYLDKTITTDDDYQKYVTEQLEKNGVDLDQYTVLATTKGVVTSDGWVQKGTKVIKGKTELNVGDSIAYDETAGGKKTVETNANWAVFGAEDGNLLIMSEDNVAITGGVEQYGLGTGNSGIKALSARIPSINDIDRITGYDKTQYGLGTVAQYGNVVTLYWDGVSTKPKYESAVESGYLAEHYGSIKWYDENG
ncbi:MAG: hypothetical protein IJ272_10660, partial [Clostridia bacterium]|nr:hypothetical protein [Clostridia bacterium]